MRIRSAQSVLSVVLVMAGAAPSAAQQASACAGGVHEEEASGFVVLPQDRLFCPLLADPKEPRTFVSYLQGEFRTLAEPAGATGGIGSVGLGDSFGLFRWGGPQPGDGLQIDIAGSIFAQFDLGAPSLDLINADYIVGVPITYQRGRTGLRLRLYHQSSHLGDEYILRPAPLERENLSFESLEAILSQEIGPLRAYGGGELFVRREPDTLGSSLLHAGVELRSFDVGGVKLVVGVDMKSTDEQDWSPAWSGRAGIELARAARSGHPLRLIHLLLEVYDGPSPYGQFFQDDIRYIGFGAHFGL